MNLSMHFEGYVEKIIDQALARGIVKTKAEALRLGLLELNQKYGLVPLGREAAELRADLADIDRIEKEIRSGKQKLRKVKSVKDLFR